MPTRVPTGRRMNLRSTMRSWKNSLPRRIRCRWVPAPRNAEEDSENAGGGMGNNSSVQQPQRSAAFQVNAAAAERQTGARSPEYARVLERYLARLVELKQIPS